MCWTCGKRLLANVSTSIVNTTNTYCLHFKYNQFYFIIIVCLNGTVFNDKTKGVMIRGDNLDTCISKHINDTKLSNTSICTDCKQYYVNLTNYYNKYKNDNTFCMDVVDLVSESIR